MPKNKVAATDAEVPCDAVQWGFRIEPNGTLLSRTIMLDDLQTLFATCPAEAKLDDYRSAIVDENILGKPTVATRKISFDRLRDLYAFDRGKLLFRALRDIWTFESAAQPMLALLCATARDPIFRAMTPYLLGMPTGTEVTPPMLSMEAERIYPEKFRPSSSQGLGRNAASSWQQAGLLCGRNEKHRARPDTHPTSVGYALLLGDLCGRRGRALFETLWARILDAPFYMLQEQAILASRAGWIEYRFAGDVIEVTFRHLMPDGLRSGV
ncbi:MAG TPA: hypothetical protein VMW65_10095 [Chloroflexota bacterium]|nr:hypothetical protein [Chloroflexota bacterium]